MIISIILLVLSILFALPLFLMKRLSFLWIIISLGLFVSYLFVSYFFSLSLIDIIVGFGIYSLFLFLLFIKKRVS